MTVNMKFFVKTGYEKGDYIGVFNRLKHKINNLEIFMFKEFMREIPKNASILDLGCGVGVPYDKFLTKRKYKITGIDFTKKHIDMAKKLVRKATFIEGDFTKCIFKKKFDAIISFYAIFHVPRSEHIKLFKKIHSLLKKNGTILITLGVESIKRNTANFVGSKMMWSSYSIERNKQLLEKTGFKIIKAIEDYEKHEHHLWVLAKKVI